MRILLGVETIYEANSKNGHALRQKLLAIYKEHLKEDLDAAKVSGKEWESIKYVDAETMGKVCVCRHPCAQYILCPV